MRVDRLSKMKDYISTHGTVSMEKLCEVFDVSINTVRRDIQNLQNSGDVKKVYGGVMARNERTLKYYNDRASSNIEAKEAIGKYAATLVVDNDIIYIDSGSTTCEVLPHISAKNVTVFTSSISAIDRSLSKDNLTIVMLPGKYSKMTNSVTGHDATDYLSQFNINKAFMSASGFDPIKGATHASLEEASTKKSALVQADTAYLLVDSSKLGVTTLINYAEPQKFECVITDHLPSEKIRKEFSNSKTKVICVDAK